MVMDLLELQTAFVAGEISTGTANTELWNGSSWTEVADYKYSNTRGYSRIWRELQQCINFWWMIQFQHSC